MDTTTTQIPRVNGASTPSSRDVLIGQVDVKLETILGHVTLTVAELNALTPDAIVSLNVSLSDPVELRLNGVVVAHGELVAVGDKFGVRITSIAS